MYHFTHSEPPEHRVPDYTTLPRHTWEGAAYYPLDDKQARQADQHLQIRVKPDVEVTIRIVEVMCKSCRRPYEDVHHEDGTVEPCVIGIHLRGGPIGERKKRKGVVLNGGETMWEPAAADNGVYRAPNGQIVGPG